MKLRHPFRSGISQGAEAFDTEIPDLLCGGRLFRDTNKQASSTELCPRRGLKLEATQNRTATFRYAVQFQDPQLAVPRFAVPGLHIDAFASPVPGLRFRGRGSWTTGPGFRAVPGLQFLDSYLPVGLGRLFFEIVGSISSCPGIKGEVLLLVYDSADIGGFIVGLSGIIFTIITSPFAPS